MLLRSQIHEAISLCKEAGRKPIYILMNPEKYTELYVDLCRCMGSHINLDSDDTKYCEITEYCGIPIIRCNVKDFLIIDDRGWYEQKF